MRSEEVRGEREEWGVRDEGEEVRAVRGDREE